MVIRPTGWFVAGIAGIGRYPAVVLFHQADIRGRQPAQLLLHTGDQFIGGWLTDILFQSVLIIIPKVCKIKAFKGVRAQTWFFFPAALPVPDLRRHSWITAGASSSSVQLPTAGRREWLFPPGRGDTDSRRPSAIPLRLVLALLPDGLQHLNSLQERLIPL